MMNEAEFAEYCEEHNLTTKQTSYIDRIRKNAPVRSVRATRSHGVVKYVSLKMGKTIDCESRGLEHPGAIKKETDSDTCEYFFQPDIAKIENKKPSATKRPKITHTPDVFSLTANGPLMEELKFSDKLEKLHRAEPWKILKDEDGRYRNLAAEEYYEKLGIKYQIQTENDFDPIEIANFDMLQPYCSQPKSIDKKTLKLMKNIIRSNAHSYEGASIKELLGHPDISLDDIYQSISSGYFYSDLSFRTITEQDSFRLFASYKDVERFKNIRKDIQDELKDDVENSPGLTILLMASDQALEKAKNRLALLQEFWLTKKIPAGVASSTLYDYQNKYKAGERLYGSGYLGLIDLRCLSGQEGTSLLDGQIDIFIKCKEKYHDDKTKRPLKFTYTKYLEALEHEGYQSVSNKTFRKLLRIYETKGSLALREGKKNAHAEYGDKVRPRFSGLKKGLFPWHVCHMDHTQMDLWVQGGYFTGIKVKPWLTTVYDPNTANVGAWYISLDPPKALNSLMALRKFIFKYRHVMRYIVFDGGKDFSSTILERFLAFFNIGKIERRTGTPTDGAEEERLNLTINNEVLYNMRGNNQQLQQARQMDRKYDPRNDIVWTLQALEEAIEKYFTEYYPSMRHDGIGCTPAQKLIDDMKKVGSRTLIPIQNLDQVAHLTRVPVRSNKGRAKANRHGLRMQLVQYGKDIMNQKRYRDKLYSCLWEPLDIRYGRAKVGKVWQKLESKWVAAFENLSPFEISCASREYRFLMSKAGNDEAKELKLYAEFLNFIGKKELLLEDEARLLEQAAEQENRRVVNANKKVGHALGHNYRTPKKLEVIRDK
tara:strand:+ start:1089 stop:3560 length:2472 start_codon:yes stop_codon:yes gene_type:complete